ncbi:hypothetical protein EVAR_75555_1 [Eumeta japonica]|uniref:Mos1 transposase HTH domain-containing protein n=1 Tax=Eumeta variegata TaxID=151549 RepID=A0A4C1UIX1_EUMVA|nr:hypothetical protein EVAR_75555_1 [Eumeta japonica]
MEAGRLACHPLNLLITIHPMKYHNVDLTDITPTNIIKIGRSCQRHQSAFGGEAPSRSFVYSWFSEFGRGLDHLFANSRAGRLATTVTETNIHTVRQLIGTSKRSLKTFLRKPGPSAFYVSSKECKIV